MTKRKLNALTKLFQREIEFALNHNQNQPLIQSTDIVYEQLEREGLAEKITTVNYGKGNSPMDKIPIQITGYILTHAGRYALGESKRTPRTPN